MSTKKPGVTNIGLELSERQQARLRDLRARMGVPQSRFLCACAEVVTDEEVVEIMRRYGEVKGREHAERIQARYEVKLQA
jgi:hypothetical protein